MNKTKPKVVVEILYLPKSKWPKGVLAKLKELSLPKPSKKKL